MCRNNDTLLMVKRTDAAVQEALQQRFAGISFATPLVAVAGTAGHLVAFTEFVPPRVWGGMSFKTVTLKPRAGAPAPRIAETEAGLLNAIGLQNDGLQHFIDEQYPRAKALPVVKLVNVAGFTINEFVELVQRVAALQGVGIIELNVSCPNVDYHNKPFGSDPVLLAEVVSACAAVKGKVPLMVKLSPHAAAIADMACVAAERGADALSIMNTIKGLKIDTESWRPYLSNVVGGYSGIGIKPIALAMVYEAAQASALPILGIGGVTHWEDVVEYMLAGASLVGIGTAAMLMPERLPRLLKQFTRYLTRRGISASDLVGAMKLPVNNV